MGKRTGAVLGTVAVLAGLTGAGALVYTQWDVIVSVVLSPFGGWIAKIVFSGKVLKFVIGVILAGIAVVVGVRQRRRTPDQPDADRPEMPPPVYGPPAPESETEDQVRAR